MASNLPPGVSDCDLPGNRPGDQEREITLILTVDEIDDIFRISYQAKKRGLSNFRVTLDNIVEQIRDQLGID